MRPTPHRRQNKESLPGADELCHHVAGKLIGVANGGERGGTRETKTQTFPILF